MSREWPEEATQTGEKQFLPWPQEHTIRIIWEPNAKRTQLQNLNDVDLNMTTEGWHEKWKKKKQSPFSNRIESPEFRVQSPIQRQRRRV